MNIRKDAPDVARSIEDFWTLFHEGNDASFFISTVEHQQSALERAVAWWEKNGPDVEERRKTLSADLELAQIPERAEQTIFSALQDDLTNAPIGPCRISVTQRLPSSPDGDWFVRHEYRADDQLDRNIKYDVYLPALFFKLRLFFEGQVIRFHDFGTNYAKPRELVLELHGLPVDLTDWDWAVEALEAAGRGLLQLGLQMKLSDYVEWTCTGEPPNNNPGDDFRNPILFRDGTFGTRLFSENSWERLYGVVIWKCAPGRFVSPLWEYLKWTTQSGSATEKIALAIAAIGEGIDAAVLTTKDRNSLENTDLNSATPAYIFRAGEAMVRLRVKLELERHIQKGKRAEQTERKRAQKGGEKSAATRKERVTSLLEEMETLVSQNKVLSRISPTQVAKVAYETAMTNHPKLWSQGSGQVEEYLGEIRRGEAGSEFQTRYEAMFPSKPLKR
jgi:hypothetical protein